MTVGSAAQVLGGITLSVWFSLLSTAVGAKLMGLPPGEWLAPLHTSVQFALAGSFKDCGPKLLSLCHQHAGMKFSAYPLCAALGGKGGGGGGPWTERAVMLHI